MSEKREPKPWPVDPETGEPATQECSHCGAKAGPAWTSWQCCRYPFGSCDGVMKPLTRPEPEPGDRERAEAFFKTQLRAVWINYHKLSLVDPLAAEFAAVRNAATKAERERLARLCPAYVIDVGQVTATSSGSGIGIKHGTTFEALLKDAERPRISNEAIEVLCNFINMLRKKEP